MTQQSSNFLLCSTRQKLRFSQGTESPFTLRVHLEHRQGQSREHESDCRAFGSATTEDAERDNRSKSAHTTSNTRALARTSSMSAADQPCTKREAIEDWTKATGSNQPPCDPKNRSAMHRVQKVEQRDCGFSGEQVFVLRLSASIRRKARRKPIATTHLDLAGRLRGKELHRVRCDKLRRACPKRDGPRSTTRAAQRTAAASQCGNKGVGVENNCRTWEAGDSIHLAGQQ